MYICTCIVFAAELKLYGKFDPSTQIFRRATVLQLVYILTIFSPIFSLNLLSLYLNSTFAQKIARIMYITEFSPIIQTGYCELHCKGLGQEVGMSAPSSILYHLSVINLSHRPYPDIRTDGHLLSCFPRTTLFVHGSNPKKISIKKF